MASLIKRGKTYYLQYMEGGKATRRSLHTDSLQVAKERLRQVESARLRNDDLPLPTRTPVATIIAEYVQHCKITKSHHTLTADLFYLRQAFGPVCPDLTPTRGQLLQAPLAVTFLEQVTTADVSKLISAQVQARGLAPKTANRFREVLHALFQWAIRERGLRPPNGRNPVADVRRYRERAKEIRFLSRDQIQTQLRVLEQHPTLFVMVAMYIYAGLGARDLPALSALPLFVGGCGQLLECRVHHRVVGSTVELEGVLLVHLELHDPPGSAVLHA